LLMGEDLTKSQEILLTLAVQNLRRLGTSRTRGFGRVKAGLAKDTGDALYHGFDSEIWKGVA